MKKKTVIEKIIDAHGDMEFLFADGFDECIIGFDPVTYRLIYSIKKCLQKLEKDGMSYEEAVEYFDFNVIGAYVGEKTPIWCEDTF